MGNEHAVERLVAEVEARTKKWMGTRGNKLWIAVRAILLFYIEKFWVEEENPLHPIAWQDGDRAVTPNNSELGAALSKFLADLARETDGAVQQLVLSIEALPDGKRGIALVLSEAISRQKLHREALGVAEMWLLVGDGCLGTVQRMLGEAPKMHHSPTPLIAGGPVQICWPEGPQFSELQAAMLQEVAGLAAGERRKRAEAARAEDDAAP